MEEIMPLEIVNMEERKPSFLKRIMREWLDIVANDKSISSGLLKYSKDNTEVIFEINKKKMIKVMDETLKEKKGKYTFILSASYPFSPPKILVNNRPYMSAINMPSKRFIEVLRDLQGKDCLCCHSHICYNNWGPSVTIRKLMNEIEENRAFMRVIAEYILLRSIKKKYLIMEVPIEEWII